MLRMLIADGSEPFATSVAKTFREEFVLDICYDGETALKKLVSTMPDVLIINLMLPYKDGLTVLQQTAFRPRIILAVSPYINNYIATVAADLGVQCLLIMPTVQTLHMRIMDLVSSVLEQQSDVQSQIVFHLQTMGFQTRLEGYRQLCIGIALFAQNPNILLCKELYPAIANQLNLSDPRAVERSIRKSIEDAWLHKNSVIWEKYFQPGANGIIPCPTNKTFLARIAEILNNEKIPRLP